MKRLIVFVFTFIFVLPAVAQQMAASFDFSVSSDGEVSIKAKGSALLQDNCYHVDTQMLEIWCDGETRWVIDKEGKEVVVETAEPVEDIMKMADIQSSGDIPTSASYEMEDGTVLHISIKNYKKTDPVNLMFSYDTSRLSDKYIVTDLR